MFKNGETLKAKQSHIAWSFTFNTNTFCSLPIAKKPLQLCCNIRILKAIGYYIGLSYALLQNQTRVKHLIIKPLFMNVMQPFVQVRNNCFILYQLPTVQGPRSHKKIPRIGYSGKVTSAASKRIKAAIDILLQITPTKTIYNPVTKKYFPFKINFVTLTVSSKENIDANFGYKNLMKPFLRKLRKNNNFSYVWKAELQKRGQLHYHIATNTFLPWSEIRNTWNNLQRKHRLLDDYAQKNKHYNANSTDVHALNSIADVGAYLAKYLSKDNKTAINGKTWDCSQNLNRKRFTFTPTGKQEMQLRQLQTDKHIKIIELDHCTIIKGASKQQVFTPTNYKDYIQWQSV
jgi:hypothetical protein